MTELKRRTLTAVLALTLVQLYAGSISAADATVKINHCTRGRGGELTCKELDLPSAAADAHLKNHANDSLVAPPPEDCTPGTISSCSEDSPVGPS